MTYNFDPDRWYDMQRYALDAKRDAGELAEADWEVAVRALDEEYDRMLARLDGTFQVNR